MNRPEQPFDRMFSYEEQKWNLTKEDDEYVLYNEYNEIQDKKEFLDMSLNSQGWDDESYFKEHPEEHRYYDMDRFTMLSKAGYDVEYGRGDFYSDGLRFAVYDF